MRQQRGLAGCRNFSRWHRIEEPDRDVSNLGEMLSCGGVGDILGKAEQRTADTCTHSLEHEGIFHRRTFNKWLRTVNYFLTLLWHNFLMDFQDKNYLGYHIEAIRFCEMLAIFKNFETECRNLYLPLKYMYGLSMIVSSLTFFETGHNSVRAE